MSKKLLISDINDSINIKKYKKAIKKMLSLTDDNEASHIMQDKIYRQFIKDIVKKSFTNNNEIQQIATLINTYVVSNDIDRWYA